MPKRIVEQAGAVVWRSVNGLPEILVVRATKTPDAWIFPKGHIEPDERADTAALREVPEETGVVGRVVGALYPQLTFRSGSERVRVQYYSVAAFDKGQARELRESQWVDPDTALRILTHEDARRLLRNSLREITEDAALFAWPGPDQSTPDNEEAFRNFLVSEYEHIGESLLRNEEDGEKRGTFFLTVVGAIGTALAFMLGNSPDLRSESVNPLVASALLLMSIVGYITSARIVTRNLATDRYKAALRRVRRYFLTSPTDPQALFLAFDPLKRDTRPPVSWAFIDRGGWLEMVIGVESAISGALVASVVPTPTWFFDGLLAIAAAVAAWVLLVQDANRRYHATRQ